MTFQEVTQQEQTDEVGTSFAFSIFAAIPWCLEALMKLAACSLLVLLLTTTGCIIIPVPEREVLAGHKITDENTAFIQPGITTRIDVMRELGQPSMEFEDQQIVAYAWEMLGSYFVLGHPLQHFELEVGNPYVLLIAFDGNDRVLRFETKARWPSDTIQEHALKWAKREGLNIPIPPSEFTSTEIPSGQSVIYIFRPGAWNEAWFFYPLGVTSDGKLVAELANGRYKAVILAPGSHTISLIPGPSAHSGPHVKIKPAPPFSFVALPDMEYYLEVKLQTPGLGTLDPVLRIRSQDNALPVLKTLERVW